jgi:hypothetical protein
MIGQNIDCAQILGLISKILLALFLLPNDLAGFGRVNSPQKFKLKK